MREDLIIDVGLYDGRDTAYYLRRGFKVVAIDANPIWVSRARDAHSKEIASGHLVLLNVGIAFEAGSAQLYYNSSNFGVASLSESHVRYHHQSIESMNVRCIPFVDILKEHGIPYYLKIDIEGLDRACLVALDSESAPPFVSWEEGDDALDNLRHLHKIGYREFKLINQVTFRELSREHSIWNRAKRRLQRVLGMEESPCRDREGWVFRAGSSGPFGPETDGRWRSYEEIVTQWTEFCDRYPRAHRGGGWHDFHARR